MTSDRIRQIHETTAYPESRSVHQALLQVWNECEQEYNKEKRAVTEKKCETCKHNEKTTFAKPCTDCQNQDSWQPIPSPDKVMTAKDWLKFIHAESYQGTRVMEDYAAYVSEIRAREAFDAARETTNRIPWKGYGVIVVPKYPAYEDYRKENQ
jgi:hypothetical protein